MKRFGWEIVKQILNSHEIIKDPNFCNQLKRGYDAGWDGYFSDEVYPEYFYSLEEGISYVPEEGNPVPGYELESQAFKLGYTLGINDCNELHLLGQELSKKLNKTFEDYK